VTKRGGEHQRFDRSKLRAALLGAAHKRPVEASDIDAIVDRVEMITAEEPGESSTERLGELCLAELRELDWGAYLQFAGTLPSVAAPSPQFGSLAAAGSVRAAREDSESS
jgi:transcriptional repressor NrdR